MRLLTLLTLFIVLSACGAGQSFSFQECMALKSEPMQGDGDMQSCPGAMRELGTLSDTIKPGLCCAPAPLPPPRRLR